MVNDCSVDVLSEEMSLEVGKKKSLTAGVDGWGGGISMLHLGTRAWLTVSVWQKNTGVGQRVCWTLLCQRSPRRMACCYPVGAEALVCVCLWYTGCGLAVMEVGAVPWRLGTLLRAGVVEGDLNFFVADVVKLFDTVEFCAGWDSLLVFGMLILSIMLVFG